MEHHFTCFHSPRHQLSIAMHQCLKSLEGNCRGFYHGVAKKIKLNISIDCLSSSIVPVDSFSLCTIFSSPQLLYQRIMLLRVSFFLRSLLSSFWLLHPHISLNTYSVTLCFLYLTSSEILCFLLHIQRSCH